jgi:hypothetical protein
MAQVTQWLSWLKLNRGTRVPNIEVQPIACQRRLKVDPLSTSIEGQLSPVVDIAGSSCSQRERSREAVAMTGSWRMRISMAGRCADVMTQARDDSGVDES